MDPDRVWTVLILKFRLFTRACMAEWSKALASGASLRAQVRTLLHTIRSSDEILRSFDDAFDIISSSVSSFRVLEVSFIFKFQASIVKSFTPERFVSFLFSYRYVNKSYYYLTTRFLRHCLLCDRVVGVLVWAVSCHQEIFCSLRRSFFSCKSERKIQNPKTRSGGGCHWTSVYFIRTC